MTTAHPTLDFKTPSGEIHSVEYRQYTLNDDQQFAALGVDRKETPIEVEDVAGIEYSFIGKLSEQGFMFTSMTENSLVMDDWDFYAWPDPEILLITKK